MFLLLFSSTWPFLTEAIFYPRESHYLLSPSFLIPTALLTQCHSPLSFWSFPLAWLLSFDCVYLCVRESVRECVCVCVCVWQGSEYHDFVVSDLHSLSWTVAYSVPGQQLIKLVAVYKICHSQRNLVDLKDKTKKFQQCNVVHLVWC